MISDRSLSLDEEAAMYHAAMFNLSTVETEVKRLPPNPQKISRKQSTNKVSNVICFRCGQMGHISAQCHEELPTLQSIEAEVMNDVDEVIEQLMKEPGYYNDETGPYKVTALSPVKHDKSWSNGVFCLNCGEFGHQHNHCQRSNYATLANELGKYYTNNFTHPNKPVADIEELFEDLY